MSNITELTVDEALQRLDELSTMDYTHYYLKDLAPNKIYDIIHHEIYYGEVGEIISIAYRDGNRNAKHTCIKMTGRRWEDEGYLHNRKNGCMSGSYSSENETYKTLKYVLDNHDCSDIYIYY